jgi:hypothetical protein
VTVLKRALQLVAFVVLLAPFCWLTRGRFLWARRLALRQNMSRSTSRVDEFGR